jgi:hypothetical protein
MSAKPPKRERWNRYYRAIWEHCAVKPGAKEEHPWGDTVFKVRGKSFAFMGPLSCAGFPGNLRICGNPAFCAAGVADDQRMVPRNGA